MKVVLDTNVLIVTLSEKSIDHDIFQAFYQGDFEIYATTQVLLEYEEIMSRKLERQLASYILEIIISRPNFHFVENSFTWSLITADP